MDLGCINMAIMVKKGLPDGAFMYIVREKEILLKLLSTRVTILEINCCWFVSFAAYERSVTILIGTV